MNPLRMASTWVAGILFLAPALLAAPGAAPVAAQGKAVRSADRIDSKTRRGPSLRPGDQFGRSLAVLGDLDGDGIPELAVGASHDDDGPRRALKDAGCVWIFFRGPDGSLRQTSKISARRGELRGPLDSGDRFGQAVAAIGDLDRDGVPDLAVGAPRDGDGRPGSGAVYVLFLKPDGSVKAEQKISDLRGGFRGIFSGGWKGKGDEFGRSIAPLGDFDGDGVIDLAVGAPRYFDGDGYGCVWLLFLDRDGRVKEHAAIHPEEVGLALEDEGFYGSALTTIGDLDEDGIVDLAIGASHDGSSGTRRAGSVFVTFLNGDGAVRESLQLSDDVGGMSPVLEENDQFGRALAFVGDLDGDGIGDLAVGASEDDGKHANTGAVHLILLERDGYARRSIELAEGAGLDLGLEADAELGVALAPLGDTNGDGTPDLVVGARYVGGRGAVFSLHLQPGSPTGVDSATFDAPEALGRANEHEGLSPLEVRFQDESRGEITAWSWDFGDGARSSRQHPTHVFTQPGTYFVTLTTRGPGGRSQATLPERIHVELPVPPTADFQATSPTGEVPLRVAFHDRSFGFVDGWSWDFGDGSSSTQQHPEHTYATPGTYTVTLKAHNAAGDHHRVREGLVRVSPPGPPTPFFTLGHPSGGAPLRVDFVDRSSGTVSSWHWDFGDGSRSRERAPQHVYTQPGTYTPSLTVTGPGGTRRFENGDPVRVTELQKLSFQQGLQGYHGTLDTRLEEANPRASYLHDDDLRWDLEVEGGQQCSLLRFTDLFGQGPLQIPPGAEIRRATLELVYFERGDEALLHEVLVPWDESVLWESFGPIPGIQPNDHSPRVGTLFGEIGREWTDVTASLRRWSADPDANQGWLILPTTGDGAGLHSSDDLASTERPRLTVEFAPRPPGREASFPLTNGSFEEGSNLGGLGPAWRTFGNDPRVLPFDRTSDGPMPTSGRRWLEITAESTFDARGPTNPGGVTAPPERGAGVEHTFRCPRGFMTLCFDTAFLLNGERLSRSRNDWVSVDISDGVTTVNVFHLDTFAAFSEVSQVTKRSMTTLRNVRVDLTRIFPGANEKTAFTLRATIGNGGDGSSPSSAYFDDFRLIEGE